MARFRLRVELSKGQRGVALATLANFVSEAQKFLRMVAEDIDVDSLRQGWVATGFYDGSVGFDIESTGDADQAQLKRYAASVKTVASYRPADVALPNMRDQTIAQFARMTNAVAYTNGHSVPARIGFYNAENAEPEEWRDLVRNEALAVLDYFDERVTYSGMIQGIIHAFYKESQPPYFQIRDLSSKHLIRCSFRSSQYNEFVPLLENSTAIVLVSGKITARRADREIDEIQVERMEFAPELSDADFRRIFGCAPGLTGSLTTEEFVERQRRNDNGE